jgi:predicted transcriptional regulator
MRRSRNVSDENQQATILLEILEKNRARDTVDVPPELLAEIAELQQQNQFDEDRKKVVKAMREIVEQYAKGIALKENSK